MEAGGKSQLQGGCFPGGTALSLQVYSHYKEKHSQYNHLLLWFIQLLVWEGAMTPLHSSKFLGDFFCFDARSEVLILSAMFEEGYKAGMFPEPSLIWKCHFAFQPYLLTFFHCPLACNGDEQLHSGIAELLLLYMEACCFWLNAFSSSFPVFWTMPLIGAPVKRVGSRTKYVWEILAMYAMLKMFYDYRIANVHSEPSMLIWNFPNCI